MNLAAIQLEKRHECRLRIIHQDENRGYMTQSLEYAA